MADVAEVADGHEIGKRERETPKIFTGNSYGPAAALLKRQAKINLNVRQQGKANNTNRMDGIPEFRRDLGRWVGPFSI